MSLRRRAAASRKGEGTHRVAAAAGVAGRAAAARQARKAGEMQPGSGQSLAAPHTGAVPGPAAAGRRLIRAARAWRPVAGPIFRSSKHLPPRVALSSLWHTPRSTSAPSPSGTPYSTTSPLSHNALPCLSASARRPTSTPPPTHPDTTPRLAHHGAPNMPLPRHCLDTTTTTATTSQSE
jgi:hypothetical protein